MKTSVHAGFWITFALVAILIVPFYKSAPQIRSQLNKEYQAVNEVFGPRFGGWALECADFVYLALSSSELGTVARQAVHSESELREAQRVFGAPGKAFGEFGTAYSSALLMLIYSVSLRFFVVSLWLALLSPFIVAAVMDGIAQRSIKIASFGYQNPTAFSLASHLLILIGVIPLAYLVLPWAVTPYFIPLWAVVAALPTCLAISHMQPVFTR